LGRKAVKITPDTNILVRAITDDDAKQSHAAKAILADADVVALALPCLCELVWVLSQGYDIEMSEIADVIRRLINSANVVADRAAVEAGLEMLEGGGDFADGVIAHEGRWLGGDIFVSFDRRAARLLRAGGKEIHLLP
jgi:predicted nucleic-acid-binding protein